MRHLISGIDCAIAGAATAVEAASPTPADFRNSRRFIGVSPACRRPDAVVTEAHARFLPVTGSRPVPILRNNRPMRNEKSPGWCPGLCFSLALRADDQERGRERIMKVSKVYSATCHQRYSS